MVAERDGGEPFGAEGSERYAGRWNARVGEGYRRPQMSLAGSRETAGKDRLSAACIRESGSSGEPAKGGFGQLGGQLSRVLELATLGDNRGSSAEKTKKLRKFTPEAR